MMAKLKRTYQSHFLIRSASPSAHARATAEPAFACPGILSQPPFSMTSALCQLLTSPSSLSFFFMVRLLHKLRDADRRLTRQDRLSGHRLGRAGGCPATPRKADDHCDDRSTNKAPNSILNLRCSLWLHWQDLLNRDSRYGAIPPLLGASTERTIPSVNSCTLPDTLTAVLLANPGACVTFRSVARSRLPPSARRLRNYRPKSTPRSPLRLDSPRPRSSLRI